MHIGNKQCKEVSDRANDGDDKARLIYSVHTKVQRQYEYSVLTEMLCDYNNRRYCLRQGFCQDD